jgi:hypothetical protein
MKSPKPLAPTTTQRRASLLILSTVILIKVEVSHTQGDKQCTTHVQSMYTLFLWQGRNGRGSLGIDYRIAWRYGRS